MSLYKEYLEERTHKKIKETDEGFCVYSIFNDVIYIEDIYIKKEFRKSGLAKQLADDVCKENQCKKLIGSVDPKANGANESIKVLLAYGMSVSGSDNNLIWFTKDLGV